MERTPDSVGLCAQAMFALQSDETTPSEIEHSILTLSTAHAEGISGTLVELLRSHSDHGVRQTAAEALGVLCTAGLVLGEYVLDSNEGPQNCTRMAQILLAGLMDGDGDVRATCVKTCALLAEKGSVLWKTDNCEALLNATIELFNDRLSRVRLASVKACKRIFSARKRGGGKKKGKKKALSAVEGSAAVRVVKLLCDEDADVRMAAIEALTKLGSATQAIAVKQIAELFIMLPWHPAVKKAFMALENVSIPVLEALEMHDNEVVRTHAGQLLQSILTESDSDCESDDNDSVNDVNLVQMDVHARGVEGLHDACTHINKTHEAWTCTCLCALCITARITCAKRRIRPAATATDWGCVGTSEALQQALCAEDVRDTLRRMDCAVVSQDEWNEYYAHTPQVIVGCTRQWRAREWSEQTLSHVFGSVHFRVGSDEQDQPVTLRLDDYFYYCNQLAGADDNPIYLFEHTDESSTPGVLGAYTIPKYFASGQDLFSVLSAEERPPHRWVLMGTRRSGSSIHQDPLLTSAWNTSLYGRKRWMLFPPECRKVHLAPCEIGELWPARLKGPSAWFEHMLPRIRGDDWRGSAPVEILQDAGETVYVPAGWHHVVLNLDSCVAVTQNVAVVHDFERIKDIMRRKRPDIVEQWLQLVAAQWPILDCT